MLPHTSFKSSRRIFLVVAAIACGAMVTATTIAAENMIGRQTQNEGIQVLPAPGLVKIDGDVSD